MKDKKALKIKIAVVSAVVIYITVSVVLSLAFWKREERLTPGVRIYGLSDAVSYDSDVHAKNGVMFYNGSNNAIYNTAPELDISYLTQNSDDGDIVYYSPSFVVGEGKYKDNGTVVRVFNEKQICTAQFSAFPANVKGGVDVAAGMTEIDGKPVTLVATAAYGVYSDNARCVRVYDTNGMLYMKIIPKFWESAPFSIVTGNFVPGDKNEYLLVSTSVIKNGEIKSILYSLSDGAVKGEYSYKLGAEHDGKEISLSVRNKADGNDSIIIFAKAPDGYEYEYLGKNRPKEEIDTSVAYAVFEGLISEIPEKIDINLPDGVTGVFSSANDGERYIVTAQNKMESGYASCVYVYGLGSKDGILLYVDYEEKRFYWNADKEVLKVVGYSENKDSYIRYAEEISVDISENPIDAIVKAEQNAEFTYWKVKLSDYGIEPVKPIYKALAEEYRSNPSSVVFVELFSSEDVLNDISLEDNNEFIRKAFADYLTGIYGSVGNVNHKFGKNFASENDISIPECSASGDYSKDAYYMEWYRFTRYRAAERITSLYSAAVSGGLSPAIVTSNAGLADYIPVDDNQAYNIETTEYVDMNSIVPEGAFYNIGAAAGLNRNGIWFENPAGAMALMFSAGFKDISVSSYSTETESYEKSFYQFLYMIRNGCKYVGIKNSDINYAEADFNALDVLVQRDMSRTSYANGTSSSIAIEKNGKRYNLVTLGCSSNGLLKSIESDGKREGSVYVVPFNSKVETVGANVHSDARRPVNSGEFYDVAPGSQVEVRFIAACEKSNESYVNIKVYHEGYLLENACMSYKLTDSEKYYRYVFKNNLELGNVRIDIECVCDDYTTFKLSNVEMILHNENTVYPSVGDLNGISHFGGITVDVIDRDSLYAE